MRNIGHLTKLIKCQQNLEIFDTIFFSNKDCKKKTKLTKTKTKLVNFSVKMKLAVFLSWFICGALDIQTIELSYMLVFHAGDQ